jgi:DivIVA domain-containing protein
MSVFQPDTESEQPNPPGLPAFQVVRRGYDPTQVDAYLPQLIARLDGAERARAKLQREVASLREHTPSFEQLGGEAAAVLQEAGRSAELLVEKARRRAETIVEGAQRRAEQAQTDATSKAQAVLAEADEAAEHIRQEVEQEQAALSAETQQVREFRDGLLEDLGRVHGDVGALLERTRKRKAQEPPVSGGAGKADADPAPDLVEEVSEPAEATQPQPVPAPTGASDPDAALASAAPARRPGRLPAGQEHRLPGRPG